MIESTIPNTKFPQYVTESTRGIAGYNVYRGPCGGDAEDMTFQGFTLDSTFTDNSWGGADASVYTWAVEVVYDFNASGFAYSNCLDKDMYTTVSVSVTTNSGDSPIDTDVMFTNTSEPGGPVYETTLDDTGFFEWAEFRKGVYDISVIKNAFQPIEVLDYLIDSPEAFAWILGEQLNPVGDLYVTPGAFATWVGSTAGDGLNYFEDFESGDGDWVSGTISGVAQFELGTPAQTVINHAFSGSNAYMTKLTANYDNSANSYIMREFNFSNVANPYLSVQIFIWCENSFDGMVFEYSENGTDWTKLGTYPDFYNNESTFGPLAPPKWSGQDATDYALFELSMPELADMSSVWLRFRFQSDSSVPKEGFAIDDIGIIDMMPESARELEYFKVWLDGIFVSDADTTFHQYDVTNLVPGDDYLAEVAAIYSNGMSAKMEYMFTYIPCDSFPGPANLAGEVVDANDVVLTWAAPPPPGGGLSEDFETGALAADWSVVQTNTGASGPVPAYFTVNDCVRANFSPFGTYHAGLWWDFGHQDEWLITSEFTCGAGDVLNFESVVYEGSTNGDHYYVKVSTDGGTTWTEEWDASALTGNAWNYYSYSYDVDLSAYAGDVIKIAFQAVDGDGLGLWYMWFVDNITVGSSTRSLDFPASSLVHTSKATNNEGHAIARDGNTVSISRANITNIMATSSIYGESDQNASPRNVNGNREVWDVQYSYDLDTPSGLLGLAGAECDGTFIYATKWADNSIVKFDLDGNFIETFTIAGVSGLRDLAFDGTYMYGAAASTTVFKMDFTTQTLVSSFTAPAAIRAIAYNDDDNSFWGNNWSEDLVNFDATGANLGSISTPPSIYGMAYDNFSDGGPFLWLFSGTITGGGCQVEQMNIASGSLTGVSHNVSGDLGDVIAGGLYIVENIVEGTVTIGGTAQGTPDLGFGFELIAGGTPPPPGGGYDTGELMGANIFRDGVLIAEMVTDTFYVDPEMEYGIYEYCVTFVYESGSESCLGSCVEVEVTEDCVAPVNLTAELDNETWDAIYLNWNPSTEVEYRYDDGVVTGQLGLSGGTTNDVLGAVHFSNSELSEMSWYLTAEGGPHNNVDIWVFGLDADGLPDETNVVFNQSVTNVDAQWNTFTFNVPLVMDGGFFLGVSFNGFIALGMDDGVGAPYEFIPNTQYASIDYTVGDWLELGSIGFPANFTIRATGMETSVASYAVKPIIYEEVTLEMKEKIARFENRPMETSIVTGTPNWTNPDITESRAFTGYNIYRNGSLLVEGVQENTYTDTEGLEGGNVYCYEITSVYSYCGESDPSNEACAGFVGIAEFDDSNVVLYPNPATSFVNITSSVEMTRITVTNYVGQVVYMSDLNDETSVKLNTASFNNGVYVVRLESENGIVTKRVIIAQ